MPDLKSIQEKIDKGESLTDEDVEFLHSDHEEVKEDERVLTGDKEKHFHLPWKNK